MLGVDLGTSHTVAMLRWPDGRVRPLLFDGRPLLPSAVYLDPAGRLHVGHDAIRLGYADPARLEPNPKRHVDAATVLLGGADVPVPDLLAALLEAVAREAVTATGSLPPAVVTYPASWGTERRKVLSHALALAGWPPSTQLAPEPVAAARYFTEVLRRPVPVGAALAVFDFGGGTLDIAVVRNEGAGPDGRARFEVAASGGLDDLGGLDIDAALVAHLGMALAPSEPAAWSALREPVTLAQWRARRQFWDDVRGAKEMLSRATQAPVAVPGVEHAVHLTRDELEMVAAPLVRRGVAEAGAVVKAAGMAPADLAGLFLVGGSSRVPLVARLLHSELGVAPTVLEQPELPVAEGAILAAASVGQSGAAAHRTRETGLPGGASSGAGAVSVVSVAESDSVPESRSAALATDLGEAAEAGREVAAEPNATPPGPLMAAAVEPMVDTVAHAAPAATGVGLHTEAAGPPTESTGAPTAASPPGSFTAASAPGPFTAAFGPPDANDVLPNTNAVPSNANAGSGGAGQPGPATPEPQYAEPVDPWATGEAAAIAAGQAPFGLPTSGVPASGVPASGVPASGVPASPAPAEPWLASAQQAAERRLPAYRRKGLWIVAAVTVVVLGVAATAAVLLWPGYPALDYRPLSQPVRVKPAVPVTSGFSAAALRDDRAYFASADDNQQLGVVAADADSGDVLWTSMDGGVAKRWAFFFTLPNAVVAVTDTDSDSNDRRMVLLDRGSGRKMWERRIAANDDMLFAGDTAVLVDRTENRVVGLQVRGQGKVAWEKKSPKSEYGVSTTKVVTATTGDDFAGAATVGGVPFAQPMDDDQRLVQIGADRSARVIDADSGDVVAGPRASVADPDDEVVAHNGRLVVAESGDTRRIVTYDLGKLGGPSVSYTAPDNSQLEHLTACGDDRICFVQKIGYDAKTAKVVAVDVAKGGVVWSRAVSEAENLVPVGESVLVAQNTSPGQTTLLDGDGAVMWAQAGVAGRLDGGNVLIFSKPLSTSGDDPALSGQHLGEAAVPLGALADVRSATCAWDQKRLACVAAEDFVLQTFAG
ncbi:Hsp70 family protein [Actinoplanes sp. NPDC049548]|uniref:Hsp70 family protein n=1 Tax=Actinoplanes sp. NPDC049548 TaxID=3155152 RepID=UPI00343CBEAE